MKKLALVAAMALTVASLAACSSSTKTETTTTAAPTTTAAETTTEAVTSEETTTEEETPAETVGGWDIFEDETIAKMPEEAQAAFDKALEGFVGSDVVPVAYLGSQVVAGTNYAYLCRVTPVTPEGKPALKVVIVYQDLEGAAEFKSFEDYTLGEICEEKAETGLAGGWEVYAEHDAINMQADVQKAFDEATGDLVGATYKPIAFLGSQLVSGANYAVLCQQDTVVSGGTETTISVVYIYAPLEGKAELTAVSTLNIADYNK